MVSSFKFLVSYIYGSNCGIALMLHRTIEEGLDAGTIVIIPISDLNRDQAEPSRWKCVLVRKDKRKDMCAFQTWKWEVRTRIF